ncbi:hypothetical protein EGR_04957 [Echinococcus granulosus]|uniref:Uncharacterized protein n=1 Tax=Echinococcus granulosus TaxID=6210 RepID=W6UPP4_ECHGR|nr:hypothetical protein EGR_04957 [Echinococcus granulosus]EUB60247.1 hypothetical protein EGR_04957 [Echinococcus granulosus]
MLFHLRVYIQICELGKKLENSYDGQEIQLAYVIFMPKLNCPLSYALCDCVSSHLLHETQDSFNLWHLTLHQENAKEVRLPFHPEIRFFTWLGSTMRNARSILLISILSLIKSQSCTTIEDLDFIIHMRSSTRVVLFSAKVTSTYAKYASTFKFFHYFSCMSKSFCDINIRSKKATHLEEQPKRHSLKKGNENKAETINHSHGHGRLDCILQLLTSITPYGHVNGFIELKALSFPSSYKKNFSSLFSS